MGQDMQRIDRRPDEIEGTGIVWFRTADIAKIADQIQPIGRDLRSPSHIDDVSRGMQRRVTSAGNIHLRGEDQIGMDRAVGRVEDFDIERTCIVDGRDGYIAQHRFAQISEGNAAHAA